MISQPLFNSPLPAFPDKQSANLHFCERTVVALFMAWGCGGETGGTREVTLKLLALFKAFQVSCAQTQGQCVKTDSRVAPEKPWEF